MEENPELNAKSHFRKDRRDFGLARSIHEGARGGFFRAAALRQAGASPARIFMWLCALLFSGLVSGRAQTTNIINLCTEEALRTYAGIGGIYQVGDCGTNVATLEIRLTRPLVIEKNFTLISTQEVLLNAQGLTRLFVVRPGAHLTLQKILLFSGRHTETNFNDGGIPDTAGAAIYNDRGLVTVLDGRFQANTVIGVTGLAGADGTGNSGESGGDAAGGAIYNNAGQIVLSNTVFTANTVTGGTGGKGGSGRSGFGGSGGDGGGGGSGAGGAIYSRGGSVTIYASTFSTNNATGAVAGAGGAATGLLGFNGRPGEAGDGVGAAIGGDQAEITVYASTFLSNTARATNGLAGNTGIQKRSGDPGSNGGDAAGGAIYSTGSLRLTNCTFYGNIVTSGSGGAGGAGSSAGFGADGGNGGNGGSATGGAIESASASIINCTFAENLVTAGSGGAAGAKSGFGDEGRAGEAGLATGSAVYGRGGAVSLANNILASSGITVAGSVTDLGGNLSTDFNSLLLHPATLRLTNPLLRVLAGNGGPTQTMAITSNSPAFNAGLDEYRPLFDQRGSNRVGRCDIGAFELFETSQPLPQIPSQVLNGLTITRGSNQVTLQWPAGYSNLFLQFATNLAANSLWSLAAQTPATIAGSNFVTLPTALRPATFFRLYGITNLTGTNTLPAASPPLD